MRPKKARIFSLKIVPAEAESDIYTEKGVDEYADNDAISASEEGFMMGYLAA